MALTFQEACAAVARAAGWDPAPWGWENDEIFVLAYDYQGDPMPAGEPDLLVHKQTGELRWVSNLREMLPALGLRPIGHPPCIAM